MPDELRELLGRAIHDARARRCELNPQSDHITPWNEASEFDRETDRCIGDAVMEALLHCNE
jgi:hypothetical protein